MLFVSDYRVSHVSFTCHVAHVHASFRTLSCCFARNVLAVVLFAHVDRALSLALFHVSSAEIAHEASVMAPIFSLRDLGMGIVPQFFLEGRGIGFGMSDGLYAMVISNLRIVRTLGKSHVVRPC
jgi:hypothetical protein